MLRERVTPAILKLGACLAASFLTGIFHDVILLRVVFFFLAILFGLDALFAIISTKEDHE